MNLKRLSILTIAACIALTSAGCEQEGPAEKAGKRIDEAVSETRATAREAGREAEEAVREIEEATKDDGS